MVMADLRQASGCLRLHFWIEVIPTSHELLLSSQLNSLFWLSSVGVPGLDRPPGHLLSAAQDA